MGLDRPDDGRFLERLRALEEGALARLFDRYFERVYESVSAQVGSRGDAEHVTGAIFRTIRRRLPQLAPGVSLERWIHSILVEHAPSTEHPGSRG